MKSLRVWAGGGVILAGLAVAVLGLSSTFAGAAGESAAQQQYEFALDHYKCHAVTSEPRRVRRPTQVVIDQFGRHEIRGRFRPRILCAPASKDEGAVRNTTTHLVGYQLPFPGAAANFTVAIGNQFGREELRVGSPVAMLLPASKSRQAGVAPGAVPTDVDHYLCYQVEGRGGTGGHTVDIQDQFGFRRMTLGNPRILCAPATKNNPRGRPINAEDHLVCYPLSPLEPHRLAFRTRDQFALLSLRLTGAADLCVPSKKAVLEVPTQP